MSIPILYSLQYCPYAMRARFALLSAKQDVMLRAVVTKNKPKEMLEISPKGTIPVLQLTDGTVIDESLDIMIWALHQSDPDDLLHSQTPDLYPQMLELIKRNDLEFRPSLSSYKYNKRYHLSEEISFRDQCEVFIKELELRLNNQNYFFGNSLSLADIAILPSIRQFANTNKKWFREANYPLLTQWLEKLLQSQLYLKSMGKYPHWLDNGEEFLFTWK